LSHDEDNAHLFFYCPFSNGIWNAVFCWLGKTYQTGVEGWNHFKLFGNLVRVKDGGRVRHLIWLVTTWKLWNLRNNVIFNGVIPDASSLLDDIKTSSWVWFTSRYEHKFCTSFSNWCLDPMTCLQSTP
jgi:hypothetical protein